MLVGCAQTGPALNSMKAELPPPAPEAVVEETLLEDPVVDQPADSESEITSSMISPLVEKGRQ